MSNNLLSLMDSFFDDYRPMTTSQLTRGYSSAPAINVKELDDKYEIKMVAPGIDPKNIKIELVERNLNISYKANKETEGKEEGTMLRREYQHYSFTRSIALPKNVDEESVEADSDKGILTIHIHKLPEAKPKTIEIKIK
ncbi:MAG: Hsp20/alpha crystallin family protein [Patescibacteria group bacterium]